MAEKSIPFNTEMVKATLAGRKGQTRRLNGLKEINACPDDWRPVALDKDTALPTHRTFKRPDWAAYRWVKLLCQVGDVLYVRETWNCIRTGNGLKVPFKTEYWHKAGNEFEDSADEKWRPSIHMPKEAARLFLKVKDVRVERLQEITEEDAIKEGVRIGIGGMPYFSNKEAFAGLWDSIYGKKQPWESNPWLWVITFDWRTL